MCVFFANNDLYGFPYSFFLYIQNILNSVQSGWLVEDLYNNDFYDADA